METVEKLREIIAHTENLVFFGGAGVSTESNIPDLEAQTVCTIRNTTIRLKRFLVTAFTKSQRSFLGFIETNAVSKCTAKCSAQSACKAGAAGKIKGSDHTKH